MNTPLSWIKAYVPELDCTEQEYMDAMTMSGTKVEGYEKFDADLDKIIVGKIEKIEKQLEDLDKPRKPGGRPSKKQELLSAAPLGKPETGLPGFPRG